MTSLLIITSVEHLQKKINETVKSFGNTIGIYVSLNKNHARTDVAENSFFQIFFHVFVNKRYPFL